MPTHNDVDVTEILDWVNQQKRQCTMKVSPVPVREMNKWEIAPTGEMTHASKGFFEIRGYRVTGAIREVSEWDQPLVFQEKMGILGIVSAIIKGERHFLLQAKIEPGNVDMVQVSPTLQATFSNINQMHAGKRPMFSEFFYDERSDVKILYKQWLAEDGGRFYAKSNLNMLVEVSPETLPPFGEDFRWMTLPQIKKLLWEDNIIGPHVRSILCHL